MPKAVVVICLTTVATAWGQPTYVGRELVAAVSSMDYPVVQAAFLFLGAIVIIGNFLADVLYSYLDPRVKVG